MKQQLRRRTGVIPQEGYDQPTNFTALLLRIYSGYMPAQNTVLQADQVTLVRGSQPQHACFIHKQFRGVET